MYLFVCVCFYAYMFLSLYKYTLRSHKKTTTMTRHSQIIKIIENTPKTQQQQQVDDTPNPLHFSQVFHLIPGDGGQYWVHNDQFRLIYG